MGLETAVVIGIVKAVAIAVASTAASYAITQLTTPKPAPIVTGDAAGLEITTGRYGTVIPRGYGDGVGIPGAWIWRSFQPWRETHATAGGKHNPGTIQYSFAIDCGMLICMNPGGSKVLGISRIKFDDVVVYPPSIMPTTTVNGVTYSGILPIVDGSANRIRMGVKGSNQHNSIGDSEVCEIRLGGQEQANIPVDFYVDNFNADWKAGYPSGQTDNPNTPNNNFPGFPDGPDVPPPADYQPNWVNYGVGAGYGPSYTNRVTVWFKFMDLEKWSRRLPQVKVDMVFADQTVAQVIIAEVQLAGLTAADVDVTAVASIPVAGLGITEIMPPKEVIGMLGIAHNFTMPLVDGKLKAVSLIPPASPPVIDLGFAGAQDGGLEDVQTTSPKLNTMINEGTELPQRVEISFLDAGRNFSSNRVGWGRLTSTNKGMIAFQWPMVLTPDQATAIAKRLLYVTRAERIQFSGQLLPRYIKYHPAEVVKIITPEGPTHTMRITKENFAVGNMTEFEGVRVIPSTYVQVASGPTPLSEMPEPNLSDLATTEFWAGDMPAMLDAHHGLQGFYVAACPYINFGNRPARNGNNWFGADLWINMAGTDEASPAYISFGQLRGSAVLGNLGNSRVTANRGDIQILVRAGARLYSMSDEQWLSGENTSNIIMLGREVIQFRLAEFLDDGATAAYREQNLERWVLSGLRRGRRGTKAQEHVGGEPCVLYDPLTVQFVPWNLSTLTFFNIRAVTIGTGFSSAAPIAFRYNPETNQFSWAVSWKTTEQTPSSGATTDTLTTLNDAVAMTMS